MWPWRWLHHFNFSTDDGCTRWRRWLHYFGRVTFDTHTADPLQTNMLIGSMIVVKCVTCKISCAYAHLDCITSTVGDIVNKHSMQVTHSYKERIFLLFSSPPPLKTNLWMIWHHKLKLPLIRVEQCAKFEAIPSIMRGTPPFQNWTRVTRWTPKDPTAARITIRHIQSHYSDVIISAMASQITGVLVIYSTVCSGANQRKHQSSTSLVCVRGIHRWPVNSPQSSVNSPHKSQWRGTCSL